MTIDWNSFTPWTALAGGALIGMAVAMLLLLNGRIAGISGVLGGLLRSARGDSAWRLSFLAGLVAAPLVFSVLGGHASGWIDADFGTLVAAGFLVGIGTRYGSGCTSGHGICGLSNLSPRSFVATVCFMATGVATVFVTRHLLSI